MRLLPGSIAISLVLLFFAAPAAHSQGDAQTIKDARFASEGGALHVATGSSVTYWNPGNKATDNYTVTATFTDPGT